MDVSRSEAVEHDLNRLIEKRHDQRKTEEGHTPSEELWKASVERYKQDGFGYGDGQRSSA